MGMRSERFDDTLRGSLTKMRCDRSTGKRRQHNTNGVARGGPADRTCRAGVPEDAVARRPVQTASEILAVSLGI